MNLTLKKAGGDALQHMLLPNLRSDFSLLARTKHLPFLLAQLLEAAFSIIGIVAVEPEVRETLLVT